MLKALKSNWFEAAFALYNQNLLRRRFDSFYVSGLENLYHKETFPLIIYANHSSWWDGLAAFQISRTTDLNSFVMMEERHLKRFFLFRRLGAFSIDRENPRKAFQSLEYAARILNENEKAALWMFPQGEILPSDIRPLIFFKGFSKIIELMGKCFVIPLAFNYEFLGKFKPEIFVKIGKADLVKVNKNFEIQTQTKLFAEVLENVLEDLKTDVLTKNLEGYQNII